MSYDGLCGVPMRVPDRGGRYLRCLNNFGCEGPHSWEKYEGQFYVFGGPRRAPSFSCGLCGTLNENSRYFHSYEECILAQVMLS